MTGNRSLTINVWTSGLSWRPDVIYYDVLPIPFHLIFSVVTPMSRHHAKKCRGVEVKHHKFLTPLWYLRFSRRWKFRSPASSWEWRQQCPPKRRYPATALHGVTTQKNSSWKFLCVSGWNIWRVHKQKWRDDSIKMDLKGTGSEKVDWIKTGEGYDPVEDLSEGSCRIPNFIITVTFLTPEELVT